ncbi:hypothetical protein HQ529_00915 [Candidatus Woesearchaeota archaeon]|nr:hypothetical protein [Candidatus Woesearchaeota archaeon]
MKDKTPMLMDIVQKLALDMDVILQKESIESLREKELSELMKFYDGTHVQFNEDTYVNALAGKNERYSFSYIGVGLVANRHYEACYITKPNNASILLTNEKVDGIYSNETKIHIKDPSYHDNLKEFLDSTINTPLWGNVPDKLNITKGGVSWEIDQHWKQEVSKLLHNFIF